MDARGTRSIDEYYASAGRIADPVLAALEAALFAEDAFGVAIPEDLMTPDRLGDASAMAELVDSLRAAGPRASAGRDS